MPNWCNTEYILRGKSEDLNACAEVINKFAFGGYPDEDRQYSTYQLIDREIEGSVNNQDARNDFQQAEIETNSDGTMYLQTWTTTAWKPEHGLVEKLCEKFNLSYLYFAEESGEGIYETNDKNGDFFSDRYMIEECNEETGYYKTVREALDDLGSRTSRLCETMEDAQSVIKEHNRTHEENKITFIKIEVV